MRIMMRQLTVLVIAGVATPVLAIWPFGGKKEGPSTYVTPPPVEAAGAPVARTGGAAVAGTNVVRMAHMTFDNAERERGFLELAVGRTRTREDMAVVARLIAEKRLEVSRFSSQIGEEFKVKPDGNYHFDKSDGILYELVAKTGTNQADIAYERKEIAKLNDKQQERFVRLASSKRLSAEQIRILRLLEEEKRLELRTIEEALKRNYDVVPEKNYEYDVDTKTIYEMVTMPASGNGATVAK